MNPREDAREPSDAQQLEFETLLADCLQQIEDRGMVAFDEICAEQPDAVAARLVERVRPLIAAGWVQTGLPRHIGGYRILRRLGEGGMGEVFLAAQERPVKRLVALKRIRSHLASEQVSERFRAERQALAMLEHPGIARVYEAGTEADGRLWFAMEYVDGEPLSSWCDRHSLGIRGRVELLVQICEAVHHAHQKGLIHRDLKPGNLLVHEVDGRPSVKVIDFGLAKSTDVSLLDRVDLTEVGQLLGTPEYMSPEQAVESDARVDIRTDVYALGVVLYELLVGVLPFDPVELRRAGLLEMLRILREREAPTPSTRLSSLGDRVAEIANRRRLEPSTLRSAVRGDLDWITTRATEKERERRYASVSEFAADLRRYLEGDPVVAGPRTARYRLRKFVAKHRMVVGGVAAMVLGASVALAVIVAFYLEAERNLQGFSRLEATRRGRRLLERTAGLWPFRPDRVVDHDAWLEDARTWLLEVEPVVGELRDLRRRHGRPVAAREPAWEFGSTLDASLELALTELVALRDDFTGPDGVLAQIAALRGWASELEDRSVRAYRDEWLRAVAEIDSDLGLRIEPIVGLVPLGPDPDSRLQEFAILEPDVVVPARDDSRHLVFDDAGRPVVLVLVPGGATWVGSQRVDPKLPNFEPEAVNRDSRNGGAVPEAGSEDQRAREVLHHCVLEPFLVSKFEITQAQWERVMGDRPSLMPMLASEAQRRVHPVESVTWNRAMEYARRLGMTLPTRAEWSHAARAGSAGHWWWGDDRARLPWFVNFADERTVARFSMLADSEFADLDDGHAEHAPVGSYGANPFGLHDVLGNLWEYTLDSAGSFRRIQQLGPRGRAEGGEYPDRRILRGGSFYSMSGKNLRLGAEIQDGMESPREIYGIRPVFLPSTGTR